MQNTILRMKEEKVHVAALITGGFHSEGISKLMDEEKLSYLVVMPKFDETSPNRPYIAILTQKPKEYEEMFKDSDFYLATASFFGNGNNSFWGSKASRLTKQTSVGVLKLATYLSVGREVAASRLAAIDNYTRIQDALRKRGEGSDIEVSEFSQWMDGPVLRTRDGSYEVTVGDKRFRFEVENGEIQGPPQIFQANEEIIAQISSSEYQMIQKQLDSYAQGIADIRAKLETVQWQPTEAEMSGIVDRVVDRVNGGKEIREPDVRTVLRVLGIKSASSQQIDQIVSLAAARLAQTTPKTAAAPTIVETPVEKEKAPPQAARLAKRQIPNIKGLKVIAAREIGKAPNSAKMQEVLRAIENGSHKYFKKVNASVRAQVIQEIKERSEEHTSELQSQFHL